MCVQGIDAQCVLQFTLIHAAGCALHRLASRVIHRPEWSFCFFVFLLRLAFPFVNARFVFVSMWSAEKTRAPRLAGARLDCQASPACVCVRAPDVDRLTVAPAARGADRSSPRGPCSVRAATSRQVPGRSCTRVHVLLFFAFVRSICLFRFVFSLGNDPSAGSPTETLLRLLLPLSDQV